MSKGAFIKTVGRDNFNILFSALNKNSSRDSILVTMQFSPILSIQPPNQILNSVECERPPPSKDWR